MSPARRRMNTMRERYDQALAYCHDKHLLPGAPRPKPTCDWPPENVALLERYGEWLTSGGASEQVVRTIYIPMAGHVLGLFLKPHAQLNLETDLSPAMEFIQAKGAGPDWTKICRISLAKFRRFLLHEHGQLESKIKPYDIAPHAEGLPAWLVAELERFQHIQQRNWRPARLEENIRRFWSGHLRLWRFLCEQRGVKKLSDVRRKHLFDYTDQRLEVGNSVSTINGDLRNFHSFMGFLQEQGYAIAQSLLRIHGLKQPERLPKYLTDEQVRLLRNDFEEQVKKAQTFVQLRDAQLNRAAFYLMWQSGLRRGEVEELRIEDLDLQERRLSVRNGKGLKDRSIYLTDTTILTLKAYLAVRGLGPTSHVFLYRNQPLSKDLIHGRLKTAGERVGVKVHAHRLRHTTATQLLNAGCPITSIQKYLGHKKLNTTMIYAKAHDQTVEADYFAAMSRVEQRLDLAPEPNKANQAVQEPERAQLLALAEQLAVPELSTVTRLELVGLLQTMLQVPPGDRERGLPMYLSHPTAPVEASYFSDG